MKRTYGLGLEKTGFKSQLPILTQMALHESLKSSELQFPFYETETLSTQQVVCDAPKTHHASTKGDIEAVCKHQQNSI